MLDHITPIILTYNEAPNIRRTLERLRWARDIVVVDSLSEDATLTIALKVPQVRVFQRRFDSFQNQWSFALNEAGITSEWVLALDADYVLSPELVEEIKALQPPTGVNGYQTRFVYCVHGKPLRASAYPPVTVLYRHKHAHYQQDGHAYRVAVEGEVGALRWPILHDDRKSLSHWLRSQDIYMRQELRKLSDADDAVLPWPDRLRKTRVLFPFVIFFYCLFVKGTILDGWAGIYYAFQRMLAEILLALYLIEDGLNGKAQRGKCEGQELGQQGAWSAEQEVGDRRSEESVTR